MVEKSKKIKICKYCGKENFRGGRSIYCCGDCKSEHYEFKKKIKVIHSLPIA